MIIVAQKERFIIIPYSLVNDNNLIPLDLIIYGEIVSLSKDKGYCYANNNYFIKENRISKSVLMRSFNRLKENGYIKMKYQCNETNSKKRTVYINDG